MKVEIKSHRSGKSEAMMKAILGFAKVTGFSYTIVGINGAREVDVQGDVEVIESIPHKKPNAN